MRISVLSLHTSPVAQPGQGDAGGMNVYVDQSVRALAAAGHRVDVFTADPGGLDGTGGSAEVAVDGAGAGRGRDAGPSEGQSARLEITESITLHHLPVGAATKDELADAIDELAALLTVHPDFRSADLIWSHYWISAEAALRARDNAVDNDAETGDSSTESGDSGADAVAGAVQDRAAQAPIAVSMHTIGAVKNRDSDTSHEPPQRLEAEERIAAAADLLVAATPAERRDLLSELHADPDSVVVARPGVDHALYAPDSQSDARKRLGFDSDEAIVLYVGRMQFIKGTDVAVDALAELRERNPHLASRTRGILLGAASGAGVEAGGGAVRPSSAYLRELTAAIASEPSVEVRPPVPSHILVDYYRAADVLIVPSRSESFGLVAAEAAASGLPAIASAVGGLPEIVEHGHSGLLIADHNPHHWATAIETLLTDTQLRAELAGHAVDRAERFDWGHTVAAVLDAVPDISGISARRSEALGAC
ncbi:D-inositol-3-phosphate glycosyltransferase [Brevibacterium iodinum ATCC 49514]|uniref:D-inositol-3-phosphate glycosyltransferase n=1 Tax=Brevibacterium iodinum ATCC 49514 TaxID=1255616 RepID=A0A2H1HVH5_9MICO|nr:glycosyltransferase [Brevibacterium iodinum]SMX66929.1 D-inositol-3-phosphate glycosyltransferase [Brevibacterium iodinum ATCC 49514]SUW13639.1 D-inositol-3-phosphate glycosyltransferase [Brevibacterium iodinum]